MKPIAARVQKTGFVFTLRSLVQNRSFSRANRSFTHKKRANRSRNLYMSEFPTLAKKCSLQPSVYPGLPVFRLAGDEGQVLLTPAYCILCSVYPGLPVLRLAGDEGQVLLLPREGVGQDDTPLLPPVHAGTGHYSSTCQWQLQYLFVFYFRPSGSTPAPPTEKTSTYRQGELNNTAKSEGLEGGAFPEKKTN